MPATGRGRPFAHIVTLSRPERVSTLSLLMSSIFGPDMVGQSGSC